MTVNQTTLDEAAKLLRQLGVKGDIITVDGGRSTYLFNSKVGDIILPQLSNPQENPTFRDLPHYLGVRKAITQKVVPQILIEQPAGKVQVEQNRPYLILWRDNINSDVSIKLSDRNNKTIQNIAKRTASDGVYEWTPNIAVKEGYTIRVASRENQKIFGNLQL